jgi:sugar/nucleoside kinase (ribokinase family)
VVPSAAFDLVAVGDVMVDVVASSAVDVPRHREIEVHAGGSAVNAARAAVAGGRSALVVGCIGDDALGRFVCDELAAAGIEARLSVVAGARTGRCVFAGGTVAAERGANAAFAPVHLPELEAAAVLVSGYQLLRPDSEAGARAALSLGRLAGVDLGSERLVHGVEPVRLSALLDGFDVVVGGERAVAAARPSAPIVVATCGRDGARAGDLHVRPRRVLEEEPIGAGDAFAAALLLALADGLALGDALARGCAAGSEAG